MKFLSLIWAGVWRRRGRTILTMLSIINAFVLFGLLQGFAGGLGHAVSATYADVLITSSRVSTIEPLPIAQMSQIAKTPGVRAVMPIVSFEGTYRSPNEHIQAYAIDPSQLSAEDPHLSISPAQIEALKQVRAGVLVPSDAASVYGLKVGDTLPLTSTLWANRDGSPHWPLQVVGIFPTSPADFLFGKALLVNYDYVDSGRMFYNGTTNIYLVRVADAAHARDVAASIDNLFANSAHQTKTVSQRQLAQDQIRQIGELGFVINTVVGAVLFALLFTVGATLIQGLRERIPEFAVLKTLGFTDTAVLGLILAESFLLCLMGAAVGLSISASLFPSIRAFTNFEPQASATLGLGLLIAGVLALVSGMPPAVMGMRLRIVDALAGR